MNRLVLTFGILATALMLTTQTAQAWDYQDCVEVDFKHPDCKQFTPTPSSTPTKTPTVVRTPSPTPTAPPVVVPTATPTTTLILPPVIVPPVTTPPVVPPTPTRTPEPPRTGNAGLRR